MKGGVIFIPLMVALAIVASSMMVMVDGARPKVKPLPWEYLTRQYYKKTKTCASVEQFIKYQVKLHWQKDKTITAKLLRLVYSDCMVTGCDASILLDGPKSEKNAPQNKGLGGFTLIDGIKRVLEVYCPGVVSCSDILHLATRDAVSLAGGPSYIVLTGRRDGYSSSASSVDLPSPNISWKKALDYFKARRLNVQDLSTLLGAHAMGKASCNHIRDRLYNFEGTRKPDPTLSSTKLAASLRKQCPKIPKKAGEAMVVLNDNTGGNSFTNSYYTNIMSHKAILHIDQQLYYGNETIQLVQEFADPYNGFKDFKKAFALAMARMGTYKVLTGKKGEIRKNCRFTNRNNPYLKH